MRIGVISDTHSREIPKKIFDDFKHVDLIIHAGDFCSVRDFKQWKAIKEVKAVYGNMDEASLCQILPERLIFSLDNFSVGIYHGSGSRPKVLESVKNQFKKEKLDIIIFGHSHQAFNETIDGILYFNPGSPNDTISAAYCSYGILELKNGKIVGKIIKI